jgi:hypothetical protein
LLEFTFVEIRMQKTVCKHKMKKQYAKLYAKSIYILKLLVKYAEKQCHKNLTEKYVILMSFPVLVDNNDKFL